MTSAAAGGPSLVLSDKVGEEVARQRLAELPRGIRFWGAPQARDASEGIPVELVRLPVAVARATPAAASALRVRSRRPQANAGASSIRVYLMERVLGHAWALSFDSGDFGRCEGGPSPPDVAPRGEDLLPPRLALEDCRQPLAAFAARATLAFGRGRAMDATELGPLGATTYPFWLRYRRDRRGRIEFAVLDAVSGLPAGSAVRAAIAAALIDADGE